MRLSGDHALAQQDSPGDTRLSVADVLKVKNDDDWILVDARATDAFNGWALDGVNRGGHIPHAVDFPASWLEGDQKGKTERLAAALRAKGIERDKHIVLYSTNERDRRRLADYLKQAGFRKLHLFDLKDWAADKSRPLVRYRNFQLLVPASIVKRLLEGHLPETFGNAKRVKFVEVSWGGENASYSKGHVPRSFHVNTDHFEPPPQWKLGNPAVLNRFATRYGFQADDTVVISGKNPTASYRLAIVLQYMGVGDVRVLNGGFAAWKAAGYPIDTTSHPPAKAKSFGARIPRRPTLIDDLARVKAGLRKPNDFVLVDNRTWAEFTGKTSGYKYHFRKGRIPGSTYGQAGFTGANSLTPYRNIDNTMRNADEILALWKKAGISTDKHLSFMCGGGWRAAEVLTFARVIGLPNTSLYSDGWIGWSNDRQNPIETGATSKTPGP
ncbi:MAG: rhodanese-like domain-containing protein [Planctomycetaceae bacterium]